MITVIEKMWGSEHWIANNKNYCGKKLILKKHHTCSMHFHKLKDETFYIQSGQVCLWLEKETFLLSAGGVVHVQPGIPHKFAGLEDSEIFEFSTHHDENDSYRTSRSHKMDNDEIESLLRLTNL